MTQPDSKDLILSRVFDAPRELVYQAFVDPEQLAQWFAPAGFSIPRDSVEIDARTGGHHRFAMASDDSLIPRSTCDGTFTELAPNELLVVHQEVEGIPGTTGVVAMTLRVELHDEGDGKTRVDLRQGPYTPEMEASARLGWESCLSNLESLLRRD